MALPFRYHFHQCIQNCLLHRYPTVWRAIGSITSRSFLEMSYDSCATFSVCLGRHKDVMVKGEERKELLK